MRLFRRFNAPLEKTFTVVYWDRRGTGKSFDSKSPRSSMTVEQFVADLDDLIDAVCKRVGKEKVAIFGHCWGSALGVLYSARFPEKFAAYVGSGQIGDWPAGEASSYAFVLAEAPQGTEDVARHRPTPSQRQELVDAAQNRPEGHLSARSLWDLGRTFLGGPESSIFDLPNMLRGLPLQLQTE